MRFHRLPVKDPRTVARDIPGICDLIFPQLLPAIIKYLNRQTESISVCQPISSTCMEKTSTNAAMLFEVAYARTEKILRGETIENWPTCLEVALKRQSKYFDAELPEALTEYDLDVAKVTSENLIKTLHKFKTQRGLPIELSPPIPGYQWISQGCGDFSIGNTLIEVKCSSRNFGSADYRQLLIYWLLSFSSALENKSGEWQTCILINPRLNKYIEIEFNDLIDFAAAGRSKIEILELFDSIISRHAYNSGI